MRRTVIVVLTAVLLIGSWAFGTRALAQVRSNDNNIAVMDDCDPTDPAWNAVGGCELRRGTVSLQEFEDLLHSDLGGPALIGHPSWRFEASYIATAMRRLIRATNWGGRDHTFTEVAEFGGGFLPFLNGTLAPAPECLNVPALTILQPGETQVITGLSKGTHKFQCCIHPWMRGTIDVH